MSKFPFKMVIFGADDMIIMGGTEIHDPRAGVVSEQAARETAEMLDAKVLGLYEPATGRTQLIPIGGEVTPKIEAAWQWALNWNRPKAS